MEAAINSFFLVLASEMGDKTQLLALVLASRFRKPWVIMAGITVATLANHGMASWLGDLISDWLSKDVLGYVLAATFFAFAFWILIPDKEEELKERWGFGAFFTTVFAFFFAEMGDKTQLATLALGARYGDPVLVTLGSTLGMLVADGLFVFFGDRLTKRVSMRWVRLFACFLFVLFGFSILVAVLHKNL